MIFFLAFLSQEGGGVLQFDLDSVSQKMSRFNFANFPKRGNGRYHCTLLPSLKANI